MNARAICLGLGVLMAGGAWGQVEVEWERTFDLGDNEICSAFIESRQGGFVLAGQFHIAANIAVLLTDSEGREVQTKRYSFPTNTKCYSMIESSDHSIVLAGAKTTRAPETDFWLLKTDSRGDSLWSKSYGGYELDFCSSIIQTPDGGYLLSGRFGWNEGVAEAFLLLKVDADGNVIWRKTYDGGHTLGNVFTLQTNDGGFFVGGSASVGNPHIWIVRVDSDGDSLWSRSFDAGNGSTLNSMIPTANGGLILAGTIEYSPFDERTYGYLIRMNSEGEVVWSYYDRDDDIESFSSGVQTPDGGFILCGKSGVDNLWLYRIDENGDSLWIQKISQGCYYDSYLLQDNDGGFIIASTIYIEANNKYYLVKTTPDPASVRDPSVAYPSSFILYPSFPNPFNSMVTIPFDLSSSSSSSLSLFDPLGHRIIDLIPYQILEQGTHSVIWNANGYPAGSYIVRLESGGQSFSHSVRLVK